MLTKDLLKETNNFSDIIFDLDNTIYQHCFFDRGAYNDIEEYFCRFNKKYIGFSKYLCNRRLIDGVEYGKLFDDAVLKFGLKFENVKKMIDIYSNHEARCLSAESSLVPILKVIVKSEQKRLFIVTNGKWKIQQTKIKKLGIDFIATDIVICIPDSPEKMKPHSWAFDILNEKHSLKNTVMVGNSRKYDGEFAKNSGIDFIYFNYKDCELYENI